MRYKANCCDLMLFNKFSRLYYCIGILLFSAFFSNALGETRCSVDLRQAQAQVGGSNWQAFVLSRISGAICEFSSSRRRASTFLDRQRKQQYNVIFDYSRQLSISLRNLITSPQGAP